MYIHLICTFHILNIFKFIKGLRGGWQHSIACKIYKPQITCWKQEVCVHNSASSANVNETEFKSLLPINIGH